MINNCRKYKHFVFLRRLPKTLMWGGLERIMMDWFERIDYGACRVTLGITRGGKELFGKKLENKKLPVNIIEFPFDFNGRCSENFNNIFRFLKTLKPSTVIFIQGAFTDFHLSTVFAAFLLTLNKVYMYESLGASIPSTKSSKYHWGIIPGIGLWWYRERFRNNFRCLFSRRVLVVSKEIKNQLTEFWGYSKNKVTVTYHGVDLNKFNFFLEQRAQARKILNIPKEDFVFIIAARLSKEKCIDRTIEAFDRLTGQGNPAWLIILGDGNLKQELWQLVQQKASKDRILFLGHKDDVVPYLNSADCYISSSDTEGLSVSLLEAMAMGLICIATNCTGSIELIQKSQSGFLVEKSVGGVIHGMQRAISLSTEEREKLTSRGVQFINQHFEVNKSVKNTLDAMRIPNVYIGGNNGVF